MGVNTGSAPTLEDRRAVRLAGRHDRMNPRYFALGPDGEYFAGIAERHGWASPVRLRLTISDNREIKRIQVHKATHGGSLGPRGEYLAIASQTIKANRCRSRSGALPNEAF